MLGRSLFAAAAAIFWSLSVLAETPPQSRPIAPGVWFIPGEIPVGREPDGNTIVFDAPKGLIVMDTGRHVWHRQAILAFAKTRGKPIAAIVNSHWHLDHVSGNPDLRAVYPALKVYASNAIDGALTGFLVKSAADAQTYIDSGKLAPETAEDLRGDIATFHHGNALKPDIVIGKSQEHSIAGKSLNVNLAPNAATAGDVWVFDSKTKVVASGDLVTLPVAFLDTACPAGWSKALGEIDATPFRILLPGHGMPMSHAQFETYRGAFDALIACSATDRDANDCAADWAKAMQPLIGNDPSSQKQAQGMTVYYVKDVLRPHGGKSAECNI